jgi:hypothetical protein
MAKWSGIIGYIKPEEVERGVWSDGSVIERVHYGDTISNRNRIQQSPDSTNSNISLMNNISIVADAFATENFGYMKYAVVKGVKWRITDIQVQYPRLILMIGGIYNGK